MQAPETTNGTQALPPRVAPIELFNAKEIVTTLQQLIGRVTKDDATPATVQAAVQCASQIAQILRLHLEAKKLSLEERRLEAEDAKIRRAEQRLLGRSS